MAKKKLSEELEAAPTLEAALDSVVHTPVGRMPKSWIEQELEKNTKVQPSLESRIPVVRFVKVVPSATLPEYATEGAAGMDLRVNLQSNYPLHPGAIVRFTTGLKIAIPGGFEGQVRPRSSLGSLGITIPNSPGTIDSDYRGELQVPLINLSDSVYVLKPGERIAQLIISPVVRAEVAEATELDETERGSGGFGSTGSI